jgi:hypothetical protein
VNVAGTFTLTESAPSGGMTVTLGSTNRNAATVPASLVIPAGATSGSFTVTTIPQVSIASVQIVGSFAATSAKTSLSVLPPVPTAIKLNASTLQGGTGTSCSVLMNGPAPDDGIPVTMTSSNPLVKLTPGSSWTIGEGGTYKYVSVSVPAVAVPTNVTLTATASGVTKTALLTINPASIIKLSLTPASVKGGSIVTGSILLGGIAPAGGTAVAVSSSNTAVAVTPQSVTVLAGTKTVDFTFSTKAVTAPTSVVIAIQQGSAIYRSTVTVNP